MSGSTAPSLPPAASPAVPSRHRRSLGQRVRERFIELFLAFSGVLSILISLGIALVLLKGSVDFFRAPEVSVREFLTGTEWSAGFQNARYGVLPLLLGTFLVAAIAAAVALPLGLLTAVFLSEYATPRLRGLVKPTLEVLAGIPTVVYGFFALTTVTPFLATFIPGLNQPTNQIAGGIVVGIMCLPMVASLSEDALRSVPRALREGAYALGANQAEVSLRVVVPAALSGITASFILALSRAVGETMAVSLACGEKPEFTLDPRRGLATMTAFIAGIAKGDVRVGTTDFNSLFAVAGTLFLMTLALNLAAQRLLRRYRQAAP